MPSAPRPNAPPRRSGATPRSRGRTIALSVYYVIVGAIIATAAVQLVRQVFAQGPPSPYPGCTAGLRALATAVDRARRAAAEQSEPGSFETPGDEDAALARFRHALEPEWTYRDGVAESCRGSARDERALDAIERLRYAEEHAVRREAGDLAPLRRRVAAILTSELGGGPDEFRGDSPRDLAQGAPSARPSASAALPRTEPTVDHVNPAPRP